MSEGSFENGSHDDGYQGPVTVTVGSARIDAEAVLRGYFEPIDGRYHWYGRLSANPDLDALVTGSVTAELRTPYGSASSRLGDVDPWGRLRVSGRGRPPFPFATTLADVEA